MARLALLACLLAAPAPDLRALEPSATELVYRFEYWLLRDAEGQTVGAIDRREEMRGGQWSRDQRPIRFSGRVVIKGNGQFSTELDLISPVWLPGQVGQRDGALRAPDGHMVGPFTPLGGGTLYHELAMPGAARTCAGADPNPRTGARREVKGDDVLRIPDEDVRGTVDMWVSMSRSQGRAPPAAEIAQKLEAEKTFRNEAAARFLALFLRRERAGTNVGQQTPQP